MIGNEINNVILWATNTNKSKILYFRRKSPHNCILPQEFFGITCCQNIKLLGITFNEALDFNEHFHAVVKKASQRLYFLRVTKPFLSKTVSLENLLCAHQKHIRIRCPIIFFPIEKNICCDRESAKSASHHMRYALPRLHAP